MRGLLTAAVILLFLVSCGGPKPTYKFCARLDSVNRTVGVACYLDKTGAVADKSMADYIERHYRGDASEMDGLKQYCGMIKRNADAGLSREDAIENAEASFKSASCPDDD